MSEYKILEGKIQSFDKTELNYKYHISDNPKCSIILIHGLGEHGTRHKRLINSFQEKSYSFFCFDLRGHGLSDGRKGSVSSFLDFVYDLKVIVNNVKQSFPKQPVILLGSNIGAAAAIRFSLLFRDEVIGMVLCGPALEIFKDNFSKTSIIAKLFGNQGSSIFTSRYDPKNLSHDGDAVQEYLNDYFNHNKLSEHLISEISENGMVCLERASEITTPYMILHGTDDTAYNIITSFKFFEKTIIEEKDFFKFDGLNHDILNEIESERLKVYQQIDAWIQKRLSLNHKFANKLNNETIDKSATTKKAVKKTVKKSSQVVKSTSVKKPVEKITTDIKTTVKKDTASPKKTKK